MENSCSGVSPEPDRPRRLARKREIISMERPSGRITELLTEIAKAFPAEKPETASSKTESTDSKESNKENSKETENSKPEPVSSDVSE